MHFKLYKLTIVLFICSVSLCWAGEKVETHIGPFDFADSLMKESQLISSFGRGYVQIDRVGGKILDKKHIYYVANEKVWVEIRLSHVLDKNLEHAVEGVLITKMKLCDEKFKPKKTFGPLVTGKGIEIGDAIDKAINIYGTPSVSINVGKDRSFSVLQEALKLQKGRVLRYLTDQPNELLFAEFYFKDEKLHSLLITVSE